jgi:fructose/tagatose bisphosphate aldolase
MSLSSSGKGGASRVDLSQTIADAIAAKLDNFHGPHHPLYCKGNTLLYDEIGTLACQHSYVLHGSERLQMALDLSICHLLFDILAEDGYHKS